MNIPANDSPFWGILAYVTAALIFVGGAALWTANGWDWKTDFPIMIGMMVTVGVIRGGQAYVKSKS